PSAAAARAVGERLGATLEPEHEEALPTSPRESQAAARPAGAVEWPEAATPCGFGSWAVLGSNQRPPPSPGGASPTELTDRCADGGGYRPGRPHAGASRSRRRRPESNGCKRLCRPLRSHSAAAPSVRVEAYRRAHGAPVEPARTSAEARRRGSA